MPRILAVAALDAKYMVKLLVWWTPSLFSICVAAFGDEPLLVWWIPSLPRILAVAAFGDEPWIPSSFWICVATALGDEPLLVWWNPFLFWILAVAAEDDEPLLVWGMPSLSWILALVRRRASALQGSSGMTTHCILAVSSASIWRLPQGSPRFMSRSVRRKCHARRRSHHACGSATVVNLTGMLKMSRCWFGGMPSLSWILGQNGYGQ